MSRRPSADERAAQVTREVAARAIRRLDILEWVILAGAGVLAAAGGALVAWMLATPLGWPFRTTWVVASLLLFGVPGLVAMRRLRRDERLRREKNLKLGDESDG